MILADMVIKLPAKDGRDIENYRVEIQNDCTGTAEVASYNVQLSGPKANAFNHGRITRAHVEGFECSRGWLGLMAEVFGKLEGER